METQAKTGSAAEAVRNDAPLSAEERESWDFLVESGVRAYEAKREGNVLAHAEKAVEKYGDLGKWRKGWKRKHRSNDPAAVDEETPPFVKRWVLARSGGMPPKEASARTGATWTDVSNWYRRSREARRAIEAMRASVRALMTEMAYGTVAECLSAEREVSAVEAKAAQWALERLERESFAERRPCEELASAAKAVGGLVINLVDTSKPYVPPALAAKGDPEEGVEV